MHDRHFGYKQKFYKKMAIVRGVAFILKSKELLKVFPV
jgi:hypothetical protein